MAEGRWQAELLEMRNELLRLKESIAQGTPTLHKDLSLVALIPKWSGSDSTVPLEEFLSGIEAAARIGKWQDADKREIAALKLTDSAKLFYQGCTALHEKDATWQSFKEAFRRRYEDVHTDQYHFTKLQTAKQGKKETPQEFADRCKGLAQKIICKADDPSAQRVHRDLTERMLLASFISGLEGVPGRQVRYANPQTLSEALRIALSVQEAEKHEKFNETFYTRFDESVRLKSRSPDRSHSEGGRTRHPTDTRAEKRSRRQQRSSNGRSETLSARNARTKEALRCYECQGFGHFARECPTRLKRGSDSSVSPGKGNPTERSKRSRSPGNKPSQVNERKTRNSGNAREV